MAGKRATRTEPGGRDHRDAPTAECGSPELERAVRELADRRAIEDALICYAHALDARDWERLRDCLMADARVKYGDAEWLEGVEAAARHCARVLDPLDASQHRLGTIDVKLAGDRATSTTYLCAEHLRGDARFTVGGSYRDVWQRTPAGWRISERRLVTSWTEGDPNVIAGEPRA